MEERTVPCDPVLVRAFLKRLDQINGGHVEIQSLVRELGSVIEQLERADHVSNRLAELLRYSLAEARSDSIEMIRGVLLSVMAHSVTLASAELDDEYANDKRIAMLLDGHRLSAEDDNKLGHSVAGFDYDINFPKKRVSLAFKSEMGLLHRRSAVRQRVERAKHLLVRDESTLAKIALTCGFASQSHMTKAFVQFAGTTPRKWKGSRCGSLNLVREREPIAMESEAGGKASARDKSSEISDDERLQQ